MRYIAENGIDWATERNTYSLVMTLANSRPQQSPTPGERKQVAIAVPKVGQTKRSAPHTCSADGQRAVGHNLRESAREEFVNAAHRPMARRPINSPRKRVRRHEFRG